MAAFAVVEGFEVVEDGGGGGGFGDEWGTVNEQLAFEGGEGAFREGIVVAVTGGTHALAQAVAGEEGAGGGGGGWAATIGVEEGVRLDDAGVQRAVQGGGDDLGVEGGRELPAEDGAAEEIEHDRQIKPACAGGDVRDVADEVGAGCGGCFGLGEQVWRRMCGVIGAWLALPPASLVPSASSVVFGRKGFLGLAGRPPERMRRATRFSEQARPRPWSSRVILGLP